MQIICAKRCDSFCFYDKMDKYAFLIGAYYQNTAVGEGDAFSAWFLHHGSAKFSFVKISGGACLA